VSGALLEVPDRVWDSIVQRLSNDAVQLLGERISSCEIKTSARSVDISIKVYAGSDVADAVEAAKYHYLATFDELRDALMERGVKVA